MGLTFADNFRYDNTVILITVLLFAALTKPMGR